MGVLSSPTLTQLLSSVRNLLNQPVAANSFWSDAELTEYINEGIRLYFAEAVANNEGYFTTTSDLNLVSGTETVALPTDCFEVRSLYKKINNGYEILSYRNVVNEGYSTLGGGSSETYFPDYYFRANNLVLHPVPQVTETAGLKLEYIQFPETLVSGTDSLSSQVSPVFKQLIEMYAVYKAKLKESMVNGVVMYAIPEAHVAQLYSQFKESIYGRSRGPTFIIPFNPEEG